MNSESQEAPPKWNIKTVRASKEAVHEAIQRSLNKHRKVIENLAHR